ncbi:IS3 family transposase [Thermodesulfobacteriota bacterium]
MSRKRYTPEKIISMLREAEVLLAQGSTVGEISRQLAISEQTYYRWRKQYGGMKTSQAKWMKDLKCENVRLKKAVADLTLDKLILKEALGGKLLSPSRRRHCIDHLRKKLRLSERRACRVIGQARATQRYVPNVSNDEETLQTEIVRLATQYGRYGYRRITALLNRSGRSVNHKCVERIWRQEGLKVPKKQPKRGHLWLNDGSCVRLRPTHRNHVWSYDFVMDRTDDGRPVKILTVIDEYSRECLALVVDRKINGDSVLYCLSDLFLTHGIPEHIRSDNGPEFKSKMVREWLEQLGTRTAFIEPGSPWENGYIESFNGKLRDELLNREIFYTLKEAAVLIENWRIEYNTVRPHSSLNYRLPAPEAVQPLTFESFWFTSGRENMPQILT